MSDYILLSVLILSVVVPTTALFKWLGIPTIISFIVVGVVLSPYQLPNIEHIEEFKHLAELGVVFLMFSIGLEFNLANLRSIKHWVFGLGTLQLAFSSLFFVLVGVLLYDWKVGLIIGASVAMSSTAIIVKLMGERNELSSPHGRQTMGVLLFQDLAVVPLLILWPALINASGNFLLDIGWSCLKAVGVLFFLHFIGSKILNSWFGIVARSKSLDLYVFNTLWIVLLISWVTGSLGLSYALGGFLSGVLISDTKYKHQVESDIKSFKDIGVGLFFIAMGMELNVMVVLFNIRSVLGWLILILVSKFLLVYYILRFMKSKKNTSLKTALQLSFAGEFGFILLALALSLGLITNIIVQPIIGAMLISMILAPIVINRVFSYIDGKDDGTNSDTMLEHNVHLDYHDHIVLCGYGRTGQYISRILTRSHINFIVIELDLLLYKKALRDGLVVIYGDAVKSEILHAAQVDKAKIVIMTFDNPEISLKSLNTLKSMFGSKMVKTVIRCANEKITRKLYIAGATDIVSEITEGGKVITAHSLMGMGIDEDHAWKIVKQEDD